VIGHQIADKSEHCDQQRIHVIPIRESLSAELF